MINKARSEYHADITQGLNIVEIMKEILKEDIDK
jgi:hypothetical protein